MPPTTASVWKTRSPKPAKLGKHRTRGARYDPIEAGPASLRRPRVDDQVDPFEAGIGFRSSSTEVDFVGSKEALIEALDHPAAQLQGSSWRATRPPATATRCTSGRRSGWSSDAQPTASARTSRSADAGPVREVGTSRGRQLDGHQKRIPAKRSSRSTTPKQDASRPSAAGAPAEINFRPQLAGRRNRRQPARRGIKGGEVRSRGPSPRQGRPAEHYAHTLGMFRHGCHGDHRTKAEQVHGTTANAFMSVSLEPPLVLISGRPPHEDVRDAARGHALQEGGPVPTSQSVGPAPSPGRPPPRWSRVSDRGARPPPLVDGRCVLRRARVEASYRGGDPSLFLGRVEYARQARRHAAALPRRALRQLGWARRRRRMAVDSPWRGRRFRGRQDDGHRAASRACSETRM